MHDLSGLQEAHDVGRESLAPVLFGTVSDHGSWHLGRGRVSDCWDTADDRRGARHRHRYKPV